MSHTRAHHRHRLDLADPLEPAARATEEPFGAEQRDLGPAGRHLTDGVAGALDDNGPLGEDASEGQHGARSCVVEAVAVAHRETQLKPAPAGHVFGHHQLALQEMAPRDVARLPPLELHRVVEPADGGVVEPAFQKAHRFPERGVRLSGRLVDDEARLVARKESEGVLEQRHAAVAKHPVGGVEDGDVGAPGEHGRDPVDRLGHDDRLAAEPQPVPLEQGREAVAGSAKIRPRAAELDPAVEVGQIGDRLEPVGLRLTVGHDEHVAVVEPEARSPREAAIGVGLHHPRSGVSRFGVESQVERRRAGVLHEHVDPLAPQGGLAIVGVAALDHLSALGVLGEQQLAQQMAHDSLLGERLGADPKGARRATAGEQQHGAHDPQSET